MATKPHTSVLLAESIAAMALRDGDVAVDCTVGAGGHTEAMLAAVGQNGRVIGIDRDQSALDLAGARLADDVSKGRLSLVKSAYSGVEAVVSDLGLAGQVRAILADIGVSSMHIDQAARGFSFMADGPLDMRMDQASGRTAADLIAEEPKEELARLFYRYGEEPLGRRIADFIVRARDEKAITTTGELAAIVTKAIPYAGKSKKHPATKVFQALRIAVNDELGELEKLIEDGFRVLADDGRLAIITFHSLEDRIVKERFQDRAGKAARAAVPRDLPLTAEQMRAATKADAVVVKPFPLVPEGAEIARNPRSRSAKLRVLEKKAISH